MSYTVTEEEDGRRIFHIDVGDMSPEEAVAALDQIKTEMLRRYNTP